jgi:hypothetical protein
VLYILLSENLQLFEEACGKGAMKAVQVYDWHKCFQDGRANVSGDPRLVRPATSTNDNMECVQ